MNVPAYFPDLTVALEDVRDRLRAIGLEAALDTADVNVPGCWVKFVGAFGSSVLGGDSPVAVEVYCLVGAMPPSESLAALSDLASEVVEELGYPDGPVRPQATTFGNSVVEHPTLVLPYDVVI